ncbi:ribbon-helix-helix domain-containing protein [Blastococcus sp. BMG 814]|uniref:Ribbon-helix-helix domain-containing protein n=1 Tax=Blastococcus carthaginiensis TaxID=3050034 RepID=A0ABT9IG09_9ACTN|nr:ribbon-helix-helix domain-containing protein [Blastococcus carthaginiensis]MDP5184520.1 ribbon-helix-helix domain-containing protein [Blastococcus carthaginiensis]
MKLSISLSDDDLAVVDEHVSKAGLQSRSAAIQYAINLLRRADLDRAYAEAWEDWEGSDDQAAWEGVDADGIG